jgi:hypothetical protein
MPLVAKMERFESGRRIHREGEGERGRGGKKRMSQFQGGCAVKK